MISNIVCINDMQNFKTVPNPLLGEKYVVQKSKKKKGGKVAYTSFCWPALELRSD